MLKLLCVAGVIFSLTACGSDSSSGSESGSDVEPGTDAQLLIEAGVVIAEDIVDPEIGNGSSSRVTAFFARYDDPVELSVISNIFRRDIDTCVISPENDGINRVDNILQGPSFDAISAGPQLSFESPGALTLLAPSITGGEPDIFYRVDPQPPFPLPTGLRIDITGQHFPAFNTSLPDVDPLTGFLPASSRSSTVVTSNTQFTWQAGTDSNARILIRSDINNQEGIQPPEGFDCELISEDGFCQLSALDFYCDVQDDGFFEFPEEIKTALGFEYVNQGELLAVRRSLTAVQQGSTALLLVRERRAD